MSPLTMMWVHDVTMPSMKMAGVGVVGVVGVV